MATPDPQAAAPSAAERRSEGEPFAMTARRPIALAALAALLLFAAVAGALAWRQYHDAQETALNNARARAVLAGSIFDIYFGGQIGTLSSIAQAPVVQATDEEGMLAFFKRVQPPKGKLFPGGLSWVDREGIARVSSNRERPVRIADVSDRSYYRQPIKTGAPFVSEGLTSRVTKEQVIATAVPTRDAAGKLTGVLVGSLLLKPSNPSQASLDLGFEGLAIIDRKGQSLLAGFVHPERFDEGKRFGKAASGVVADTNGLDGESGHVLAFARAKVPGWTVILDRPRSEVFAAARRTLVLEILLLGGVALLDLILLLWIVSRARSEARAERERALQRRQRYEQEHKVATTLQRSLLVDVPEIESIESAARYQPGSTGLEVGGDWFDVLRRPDGIVHITVGDVAGHGVAAAALMGQLRNAFRAYAHEHVSPAALMSRLHRHIGLDEMATAVVITIDPYARELAYASAGHPPPLLRDDETREVMRLEAAQSPVLAHVSRSVVSEGRLELPSRATLVAYTDGMVERRDRVIDEGIERLSAALRAAHPGLTASALADGLIRDVAAVTDADDDIALLVMRFAAAPTSVDIELDRPSRKRCARRAGGCTRGCWLAASARARARGRCGTSTKHCSRTTTRWSRSDSDSR